MGKNLSKIELVLLPGLDGTGELFKPFLEKMSGIQITQIKYPLNKKLTMQQLIKYVRSQMPEGPCILLAESFSGTIGYQLALDSSLQIQKVIFVASFISNPNKKLLLFTRVLPIEWLFRLQLPHCLINYFCFNNRASPAMLALFRQAILSVDSKVLAQRVRILATLKPPTKPLNKPCLIITAINDRLLSNFAKQQLIEYCTDKKLILMQGPHFILQTQAEDCATQITHYLF
ncbi:serine aminopeptidase domain-containing protein [Aliikangiella sp. IMCC44359]|uniref:serine aminopeptidase domain-containing protein n=1 Tax=Aliikangiella sp. IMCC44359 TaxID=3459125 RepID=UPI00403AFE04